LKIDQELLPLKQQFDLLLRDYMIRLDELATEIGVGKYNKEFFEPYMADEANELLTAFGHQDTVLSNLYQKYAHVTLDELYENEDMQAMLSELSDEIGVELNMEELLHKGRDEYFAAFKEKYAAQINDKLNDFTETEDAGDARIPANKKHEAQDVQIAKDARRIYMQIIKKYHPDLEKDAAIREEKTEIIKQVTKAYNEKDFLSLLKLQLTYIDDNEAGSEAIADDMLKRYIKLLKKQQGELERSIQEAYFMYGEEITEFIDKNGKFSPQKFAASRRRLEKNIGDIKLSLKDSKKKPKGWFKEQLTIIKNETMQNMIQNMFESMYDVFE